MRLGEAVACANQSLSRGMEGLKPSKPNLHVECLPDTRLEGCEVLILPQWPLPAMPPQKQRKLRLRPNHGRVRVRRARLTPGLPGGLPCTQALPTLRTAL